MTRYWVEAKEDILAANVGVLYTIMWQQGPFLKYLFVAHLFWNGFVFSEEESSSIPPQTPSLPNEDLPPLFQDVSFQ